MFFEALLYDPIWLLIFIILGVLWFIFVRDNESKNKVPPLLDEENTVETSWHEEMLESDETYLEINSARERKEQVNYEKELGGTTLNGYWFSPEYIRDWEREKGTPFPIPKSSSKVYE